MNMKSRLITALVRLYPAPWRREYGAELEDLLRTRPLGARAMADVAWHGIRERLRSIDLATGFGLAAMLVVAAMFANGQPVLEPSQMTFPAVSIPPLHSNLYALFLVGCGWAIHRHSRTSPSRTGLAAMKISVIASLPVIVAGLLLLAGVARPGALASSPAAWHVLGAPMACLGQSWIWGAVGGALGRAIARRRSFGTT
jgi:hypothetical protein